mmetsp:Transcript_43363/g.75142  ORF Transcript_43363/g.75142 Transcript_43363/m.75142 type:complete len:561 (+) Transcript_43363:43-1725(+)
MTERTLLAWLLLFHISPHLLSVRTHKEDQGCHNEDYEDNSFKDVLSTTVSGRHHNDGFPAFQRSLSSLMMLHQGSLEMLAGSSLIARARSLSSARGSGWGAAFHAALIAGSVLLAILLLVVVVGFCFGGSFTPFVDEVDDDSDGSVVALGQGLDPVVWWKSSKSSCIVTSTGQLPGIKLIAPPWNCESLNSVFRDSGLAGEWEEARTDKLAEELTVELSEGKSSLFSQSGSEQTGLTCIIYVMQLALHYVPENLVLQEFSQSSHKTVFVTDDFRLPKTKIRNCERVEDCFMRCLTLKLGISQDTAEKFASNAVLLRGDEEATDGSAAASIPKMQTTVRKLTVLVPLENADNKLRKDLGIDKGMLHVNTRGMEFRWENVSEDYGLRKLLKKRPDARKVKPSWKASGLAVIPWTAGDVMKELTSHRISPDSFGQDFPLLVQMLRRGQVQLGIEEATGNLICVEQRVHLKLFKKNGDFLVHEGQGSAPASLPFVQLLANETHWIAALRAARSKLGSGVQRVELQLRVQDVQSTFTPEPPKMFASGHPLAYVVRETMVDALASS